METARESAGSPGTAGQTPSPPLHSAESSRESCSGTLCLPYMYIFSGECTFRVSSRNVGYGGK